MESQASQLSSSSGRDPAFSFNLLDIFIYYSFYTRNGNPLLFEGDMKDEESGKHMKLSLIWKFVFYLLDF